MAWYEKRKSGWSVCWREIINGEEVRQRLSGYPTKKAAETAYNERQMLVKPSKHAGDDMTLAELCEAYLRDSKGSIKESSLYEVENRLRNHILPVLGDKKIKAIKPLDILKWQNDLSATCARSYVLVLRYALSAVWNYGKSYQDVVNDPLPKVKPPKDYELPKEMQVWTVEEYRAFREAVCEPLWGLLFDTLYLTGCRKGEALALSSADVCGDYLSVSKSITRKGSAAWQVTTPKTKESIRKIKIPPELAERLKAVEGRFIFGGDAPFADRTVERKFKEAIAASGVKPIRMHDLRHSHASLLISSGCSIVAVSKRLGHKSTKQTLDTYAHFLPEDEDLIVEKLGAIWGQKDEK